MHVNIFLIFQRITLIPFIFLNRKTFLAHFSVHMKLNFRNDIMKLRKRNRKSSNVFYMCIFYNICISYALEKNFY